MITSMGTPQRSSSARNKRNFFGFSTPQTSPTRDIVDYEPPRRSAMIWRGARDLTEFSTPQRLTVLGREREVVEFRTPQHPLAGTNNWGGASPLLSRNIPKQSLESSYLRFNAVSILGHDDGDETGFPVIADLQSHTLHATPARHGRKDGSEVRRDGILSTLRWRRRRRRREEEKMLGCEKKKSRWLPLPGLDHRTRWPQGWC